MSLRSRLWLVLGALVLLPVLVTALVLLIVIPSVQHDQVQQRLQSQRTAAMSVLADQCRVDGLVARSLALESAATTPRKAVEAAVASGQVSYAAILDKGGKVVDEQGATTLPPPSSSRSPRATRALPPPTPSRSPGSRCKAARPRAAWPWSSAPWTATRSSDFGSDRDRC